MGNRHRIKEKLVLVIGNLICRSIEEARRVPYVLEQDNVVDILVSNPELYQQMVLDGQIDGKGMPAGKVVVKLDILSQVGDFKALDRFDMSFSARDEKERDLSPIFGQINLLTKMLTAYTSNMITLFEREYEQFLERLRHSVQGAAQAVRGIELDREDLVPVEKLAENHLLQGSYLEAFSFGRLLSPDIIRSHLIRLPSSSYCLCERLMETAPQDSRTFSDLVKFILRASYVSQNSWQELYGVLVRFCERSPKDYHRSLLIDLIDQDFVFSCNLLHEDLDTLRRRPAAQRKALIGEQFNWDNQRILKGQV